MTTDFFSINGFYSQPSAVNTSSLFLSQTSEDQKSLMAEEIQRRAKCLAYCYRQVKETFKGQLTTETELLQVAIGIYHEVFEQFSKITLPEA